MFIVYAIPILLLLYSPIEVGKCVVKTMTSAENGDVVTIENGISKVVVFEEPKYKQL